MNEIKNVLVIDDDISLTRVLSKALNNSKTMVECVNSISKAWVLIEKKTFDLIITDVMLPDGDGLELVEKLQNKKKSLKIIVISAKNNLLTAVKASELGVFEYMPKPIDLNDLTVVVNRSLKSNKPIKQGEAGGQDEKLPIIGRSQPMQKVYRIIAKLMKTDLTVLITGESGTGKELVAKAIHDFSSRSNKQFLTLNMAAIPQNLIESELFGYEKGAFTGADSRKIGFFEEADGGTIFLDEIGDMPFEVQARLLRVLQLGEFTRVGGREKKISNVRIIAATNAKLKKSVDDGIFREDLYYRLNVVNIEMPALRTRVSDIFTLSKYFLNIYSPKKSFNEDCKEVLENYSWPGNVRELENFIKKIAILFSEDTISKEALLNELAELEQKESDSKSNSSLKHQSLSKSIELHLDEFFQAIDPSSEDLELYKHLLAEFERPLITRSLDFCNGNQFKAAKILGINRNTLRKKMKVLNIDK
tara:strand:- start:4282 stop:5706 length:1425 start_codon:yes stop_codon:yes gene_type:complete